MTAKERIVIVGNGMAGGKLAEELASRERDRFDITIIGDELYGNYNRIKLGVSGCPRNCSEATIKDFGVVAVEGGWDLYIGGNGGAHVYVAQKIAQVQGDDAPVAVFHGRDGSVRGSPHTAYVRTRAARWWTASTVTADSSVRCTATRST